MQFNSAMLKETSNATKLRLEDISMVSYDARMVCCHNLSGLQAAPQIANNSASIKFGKPSSMFQKKEKQYFLRKNIVQRDVCFENFGKPEQICKSPGIIALQIQ